MFIKCIVFLFVVTLYFVCNSIQIVRIKCVMSSLPGALVSQVMFLEKYSLSMPQLEQIPECRMHSYSDNKWRFHPKIGILDHIFFKILIDHQQNKVSLL